MVSTRVQTAKDLVNHPEWPVKQQATVEMIFMLERCGYRVVKADETLEYHGIPKPGTDEEG